MIEILNRNEYLIKEQTGLLKAAFNFDVQDPATGEIFLACREEKLGRMVKLFRFSSYKRTTPFDIQVRTTNGEPVLRVARRVPKFVSRVKVFDENDNLIGGFKQKLFSISGAFDVLDASDNFICRLKGGMTGLSFRFLAPDDVELARVDKKWAGIGKELWTSAGDYLLRIDEAVPKNSMIRQLILASVLCIGMIVKVELP